MERLKVAQVPETNGMQYCVLAADNAPVGHVTPTLLVGKESAVILSGGILYTWSAIGESTTYGSQAQQIEQIIQYYQQLDSAAVLVAKGIADLYATPTSITLSVGYTSVVQLYTYKVAGLPAFKREDNTVWVHYVDPVLQQCVSQDKTINLDMLHYSILTKVESVSTPTLTRTQCN